MAARIKKDDTVEIIAGDHKGATGKVLRITDGDTRVYVAGVNLAKKHVRPSQKYPQGGQIQIEQPIQISNVQPVNPKTGKGTRVRFDVNAKGEKNRVALDGTVIGVIRKAKK